MKTYATLQKRGINAAKKFLERKGYEILDDSPKQDAFDLVAIQDGTLSMIAVATRYAEEVGFPKDDLQRDVLEIATASWLSDHTDGIPDDVRVSFDSMAILVLSESKAFLRFHTNVLGAE